MRTASMSDGEPSFMLGNVPLTGYFSIEDMVWREENEAYCNGFNGTQQVFSPRTSYTVCVELCSGQQNVRKQ